VRALGRPVDEWSGRFIANFRDTTVWRATTYAATAIVLSVGYLILRGSGWHGGTELHTLMETVAALLAMTVGAISLLRFYSRKNNTFLFVGAGFLGTAFLDGYHAIVTSTYFASNFPSAPSSLIPWSWIASRVFLSSLMCISWLAWMREARLGVRHEVSESRVYTAVALLTISSFLFFAFVPLPRAYYPNLVFHRPEEFVPAVFFLLALVGYLRKGHWKYDQFEHWLVLSLIVGFMGQAMFMSFSGQLFDMEFDAAHLLKKVSYICVLIGLLISMYSLFRQAEKGVEIARINDLLQNEILERQRAEEMLQEYADELARSNQELKQFAYVASHDLREPLRKVSSFTQLLARRYHGKLDTDADEFIGFVVDGANRMQQLIEDLLEYSKVGSTDKTLESVDSSKVFKQAVANCATAIEENSALVTLDELPTLEADPVLLRQVFQNLIANGIKFRREAPPEIHASARLEGQEWVFSIRDNGIGIEAEFADRIFTIFQRLHSREEYAGTGIGLAICRKIVEGHGGRIWFESEPGEGSTFRFSIRLKGK
jgi:signal transduction histidine kinase